MNHSQNSNNSSNYYQCSNDGKYIPICCPICPHCGFDNSKYLVDKAYNEYLIKYSNTEVKKT